MSGLSDLSPRDRRAVAMLAVSVLLSLGYRFLVVKAPEEAVSGIDSVPLAERRLNSLRLIAAALPAKEAVLKELQAELASREKTIISAGTAAQAQANLLEVTRRVGNNNGIEIRGGSFPSPKKFGDVYGEVLADIAFNCSIDQFVNFFADLSRESSLLAPDELTINMQDPKQKTLAVHMVLSGVVPNKLVPEKKGYGL